MPYRKIAKMMKRGEAQIRRYDRLADQHGVEAFPERLH
jgi:hypothetical protein